MASRSGEKGGLTVCNRKSSLTISSGLSRIAARDKWLPSC
jgi:hypothetical protein